MLTRWWIVLAALWLFAAPARAEDVVLLFTDPNFEGGQLRVTGDVANLREYGMNDEISSMIVLGGEWAIYEHDGYQGKASKVPPGRYPDMGAVFFDNNSMSSIRKLVATPPPPPPPPPVLADLQREVEARTGYQGVVEGEDDARIARDVTFRGLTAYVTVTNKGKAEAAASTLTIEPAPGMAAYVSYISGARHPCPEGQVPWPAKAGGPIACTALKSGDIVATAAGAKLSCAIPKLAVGKSARCVGVMSVLYNWLVPDFGDWSIAASADTANAVKESNEKNNGVGVAVKVTRDELPPLE